jgi:hypothetical protein
VSASTTAKMVNGELHERPNLTWERERAKGSRERESGTVLSPLAVGSDTEMSPHTICTQLRSGSKYRISAEVRGLGSKSDVERAQNHACSTSPWPRCSRLYFDGDHRLEEGMARLRFSVGSRG